MEEKDLLEELEIILDGYIGNVKGTQVIFIATLDGHMLLEKTKFNSHPLDQVAPMAGSVLGISGTLSEQLLKDKLKDNIILMEKNMLGLFKIEDKEDSLFLGVLCDRVTNIGTMVNFARLTKKDINKVLIELL